MTDRETDVAVAKALGCTPVRRDGKWDWICPCDGVPHRAQFIQDEQGDYQELASYSTSDADALAALDAVMAKHPGWGFELTYLADRYDLTLFDETYHTIGVVHNSPETRAAAICAAILALVGTSNL